MGKFKITITLDTAYFEETEKKSIVYLYRNEKIHTDEVTFDGRRVVIEGSRSSKITDEELFETIRSTYYKAVVKSLLHVYFAKGSFRVLEITCKAGRWNLRSYQEEELFQPFTEDDRTDINTDVLFGGDKTNSDLAMNVLMQLAMSYSDKESFFDHTYKALNKLMQSFYAETEGASDRSMLNSLSDDIGTNRSAYPRTYALAAGMTAEEIKVLHLMHSINNDLERDTQKAINKFGENVDYKRVIANGLKPFTKPNDHIGRYEYEDDRLMQVVIEQLPKLKKSKYFEDDAFYEAQKDAILKKATVRKDEDIIRFVFLEYSYYLRCTYFHGTADPVNFLIPNDHLKELTFMNEVLRTLITDIMAYKLV